MTNPWTRLWTDWLGRLADAGASPAAPPLHAMLSGYREFAAAMMAALKADQDTNPAAALAAHFERLLASLRDDPSALDAASWFGVPLRWAESLGAAPLFNEASRAGDLLGQWTEQWLALPLLGPQREWHAAQRELQRALFEQRRCNDRIGGHYRAASASALGSFAGYLRADDGETIETLSALYDRWIEHAESAYRDTVMMTEFSRDFGALVDASSRVRAALNAVHERTAAALDLPARRELDQLHQQQRELRRELAALRAENQALSAAPAAATNVSEIKAPAPPRRPRPPTAKPGAAATRAVRPAPRPARKASKPARKKAADEFDIGHILGTRD